MKRLTTFLIAIALIFQGTISLAQIDEAKMERDLRVASGVLSSLLSNDSDHLFRGREPEGNYVEGFGIIFTVEDNMVFKYNYQMQYSIAVKAQKEAKYAVKKAQRAIKQTEREVQNARNDNQNSTAVAVAPIPPAVEMISGIDKDEMKALQEKSEKAIAEFEKNLKEAFEIFLVDYSQLIGQLKPTDKVLLTTKSSSSYNFVFSVEEYSHQNTEKSKLSAEMLVKDHKDFSAGKLSREKLIAKIRFVENAEVESKPDLDLFSNMLKTTYNSKYTETYFISSTPKYEVLNGLGVVYSLKVYSSYNDDSGYRMPGNNKSNLSESDRDKAVEVMYPQFVDGFKENIIRYGSTIKSLNGSDKLIIKVKMTKCDTCTFPATIEFMVDKSVLDQFTKGSLTLAQAKGKVKLN